MKKIKIAKNPKVNPAMNPYNIGELVYTTFSNKHIEGIFEVMDITNDSISLKEKKVLPHSERIYTDIDNKCIVVPNKFLSDEILTAYFVPATLDHPRKPVLQRNNKLLELHLLVPFEKEI